MSETETIAADSTATVATAVATANTTTPKQAKTKTGDMIHDIAAEVEGLTKTKALNAADKLAENLDETYFRMGGVLKLISDNSWFEGFESFDLFVFEKFGFAGRKARYLIHIYTELVTKQIPWEKVAHLGWTKLKELASVLTIENVDEWVGKAEKLTVAELIAALKATTNPTGDTSSGSTTSDVVQRKFKLKQDQAEVVDTALAKAKGEIGTEFDNVALENICAGYVGGNIAVAKPFAEQMKSQGWQKVLEVFGELWPTIDMDLKVPPELMA